MSLVLAAFFTSISKKCDTKTCHVRCVQGPLWLFLKFQKDVLSKSDFSTSCCKVLFSDNAGCFSVVLLPLFAFPNMTPLSLLYKGLLISVLSVWKITVVVQSRNVWENKESSFRKQLGKQTARWSISTGTSLTFHTLSILEVWVVCESTSLAWILS